jgi:hypothetical protein
VGEDLSAGPGKGQPIPMGSNSEVTATKKVGCCSV